MKTAISIPDTVFEAAEETAARLGMSRSQLYTKAVAAFVERQRRRAVTEELNAVYQRTASKMDPVLARLQFGSLPKEDW